MCGCTCLHQFIDWIKLNYLRFSLFIVVCIIFGSGRRRKTHINRFIKITRNISFCESIIKVWCANHIFCNKVHQVLWSGFGGLSICVNNSLTTGHKVPLGESLAMFWWNYTFFISSLYIHLFINIIGNYLFVRGL